MDVIQGYTSVPSYSNSQSQEIAASDTDMPQAIQINDYNRIQERDVLFQLELVKLGEDGNNNTSDNDQGVKYMHTESKAGPSAAITSQAEIKYARKLNQLKRNSGQLYKTKTGKLVEPRKIKPLEKCRSDCRSKLSFEDQTQIFNSYWQNASYKHRFNYVSSQISIQAKKRVRLKKGEKFRKYTVSYYLNSEGQQISVCKKCFRSTLGETDGFCKNVVEKCWFGMNQSLDCDQRGKHIPKNKSPPEKLEEISNHIAKFPVYENHYSCSHGSVKYLSSELNVKKMHQMYSEEVEAPLSLKMYRQVFLKTGLRFKGPQFLDTCSKCDNFDVQLEDKTSEDEEQQISLHKELHQNISRVEYTQGCTSVPSDSNSHSQQIAASDTEAIQINNYSQNEGPDILFELKLIELEEDGNNNTSDNGAEYMHDESPSTAITSQVEIKDARKLNQFKRNSGQVYKTKNGKLVESRKIIPLEKCRSDCRSKLSFEDQTQIFNSYWQNASYKHRFNYVSSQISIQAKKRVRLKKGEKFRKYTVSYYLNSEGQQISVCKKCFRSTLGETDGFCKNVVEKCWFGMNQSLDCDQRGKHIPKNKSPPEKLEEISNHIAKFPVYENHYSCSHGSVKYLSSELNVKKMHQMYSEEVEAPLSLKMYRQVFLKTGLKFKKRQLNTCSKCDN